MDLNKIIKDLWPEIFRFVYYKVQNKEEAEEITQDTFEKVFRKLEEEKVDKDKIKSYSLSTANNRIIDVWRKKGRRPKETQLEDSHIFTVGVPDKQKEVEDKLMVRKAMEQLPEQSRQVLLWRIVEGYSIQEVAQKLGKSPGSIKSTQFRALQNLKTILEKGGYSFE